MFICDQYLLFIMAAAETPVSHKQDVVNGISIFVAFHLILCTNFLQQPKTEKRYCQKHYFQRVLKRDQSIGNSEGSPFQMSIKMVPKPFTIFHF